MQMEKVALGNWNGIIGNVKEIPIVMTLSRNVSMDGAKPAQHTLAGKPAYMAPGNAMPTKKKLMQHLRTY